MNELINQSINQSITTLCIAPTTQVIISILQSANHHLIHTRIIMKTSHFTA